MSDGHCFSSVVQFDTTSTLIPQKANVSFLSADVLNSLCCHLAVACYGVCVGHRLINGLLNWSQAESVWRV